MAPNKTHEVREGTELKGNNVRQSAWYFIFVDGMDQNIGGLSKSLHKNIFNNEEWLSESLKAEIP